MRSDCPFHCRSAPTIPNTWRYLKQNKGPDQNHPRRPHPRPAIAPVAALPESSVALPGLAAALLELAAALPGLPAALPELAAAPGLARAPAAHEQSERADFWLQLFEGIEMAYCV